MRGACQVMAAYVDVAVGAVLDVFGIAWRCDPQGAEALSIALRAW